MTRRILLALLLIATTIVLAGSPGYCQAPPARDTAFPRSDTPSPKRDTVPARRDTAHSRRDTVPGKTDTLTGARGAVQGKSDTMPGKKDSASTKRDSTRVGVDTVPVNRDAGPVRMDTSLAPAMRNNAPARDTAPISRDTIAGKRDTVALKGDSTAIRTDTGLARREMADTSLPGKGIRGRVTDASGQPLVNVNIQVKGGTRKAVTDEQGNFSIDAGTGSTLVFSFVGYQQVEQPVTGKGGVNVQMQQAGKQMQEVVVTALGINRERRAVGYSVSEVKGASLTEARENNFVNSLEGRVAGVNVSGVATGPNGASNVVIRGITSMTGNNQPLYVINGVPLVNTNYASSDATSGRGGRDGGDGIGDINPDDIETVSILKGAAATALYGYRGANGVVLITTKKGRAGSGLGVEVNSNYVMQKVIDQTDFQNEYGQGGNGAKPVDQNSALGSMESSWGARLDGSPVIQFDGVVRPYSAVAKGNLSRFYRTGGTTTNTVSFSKGFEDAGSTRFSVSHMYNSSYVPNASLNRLNFSQNTNLRLDKHLTLDLAAQYVTETTKNAPNVSNAIGNLNWGPMFVPRNINITSLAGPNKDGTDPANGYELNPFADVYTTNPYFAAYRFMGAIHRNRFIGSANLKYSFDNGFFIGAQVANDYTNDRLTDVTPTGTGYSVGGAMTEQSVKQGELNIDITAGKRFKLGDDLSLNTLVGGNYRSSSQEFVIAQGQNFATEFLYNIANLTVLREYYALNRSKYQSVYASADLAYKDWLYLTLTGRNDWYSTLAPGKINYFYPSASASLVFSELFHIKSMDLGKLRLSYASAGGAADAPYQTLQSYGIQGTLTVPGGTYPIGNAGSTTVPNNALRPSKREELELGTEMNFWKSRLRLDLAVFQKKVIDDIIPVTIDITSGYSSALLNVGTLRVRGIEMQVGGVPLKTGNFSWDIDVNAAYNATKILSLGGQPLITLGSASPDWGSVAYIQQIVGKPAQQIVAQSPELDDQKQVVIDPTTGAPDPSNAVAKAYGSVISPWTGGITNTFRWGNFNLAILIDGKFGGKLFSNTNFVAYTMGLAKETLPGRERTFGTDDVFPATYYNNWANANQGMFVYDASFIKFRQIVFGYDFPSKLFHGAIRGMRLSFVTRNVFTIKKSVPNVDPETNYTTSIYSQGLESASVPYSRTFGFNLNVKF